MNDQIKQSKKFWLVGSASVAALLMGIIALWAADGWMKAEEERKHFNEENLAKLKVGMTLKQMEEILGPSRSLVGHHLVFSDFNPRAWNKAKSEGRVRQWYSVRCRIDVLAAFPCEPSADTKVDVFNSYCMTRHKLFEQKPYDKWTVSKDIFQKLKVGMTLPELEDILGVGEPAQDLDDSVQGADWKTAVKEYRVYRWATRKPGSPATQAFPVIIAGFSTSPSADPASTVLALSFRNGSAWDEDKGTLAGVQK
jgi:hypothetical protein